MKATKIVLIFVLIVGFFLVGCERSATKASLNIPGPVGPEGPQGEVGPVGPTGPRGVQGDPGKDADPADVLDLIQSDPEFLKSVAEQIALSHPVATVEPTEEVSGDTDVESPEVDPDLTGGAVVTKVQDTKKFGQWKVQYFTGATTLMKDFKFTDFVPGWEKFPNEDWSAGDFLAKNGLEYGQELSDFCQQDKTCDFPVAARSFRTITADYDIAGIRECHEAGTGIGCAIIIVNMGDVTASFRDQMVDTGHTITGLYWNGDEIDQAISAWASHVVYRMVGVPSPVPANPGANCSVPNGCKGVDITFAIISGNELLVLGNSIVQP